MTNCIFYGRFVKILSPILLFFIKQKPIIHSENLLPVFLLYADAPGAPRQWWFGGGTDFTPAYIFEEDVKHFHSVKAYFLYYAITQKNDIHSFKIHTEAYFFPLRSFKS